MIIPTKDRHEKVLQTVLCLLSGSRVPDEILVVDDGSRDRVTLKEVLPRNKLVQIITHSSNRGSSAARNTGAKSAKSEILIFLDDDTIPSEGLVKAHLSHHLSSSTPSVAMGSLGFSSNLRKTVLRNWLEVSGDFSEVSMKKPFDPLGGLISANFSIRRTHFQLVGGFDENFPFNRNEDTDFGDRARRHGGLSFNFLQEAFAGHDSAIDLDRYLENTFRGGISKAYWSLKAPDRSSFCREFETTRHVWFNRYTISLRSELWKVLNRGLADRVSPDSVTENKARRFERQLAVVSSLHRQMGLAVGWQVFSATSREAMHGRRRPLVPSDFVGSDFFPGVWSLTERLIDRGEYSLAENILKLSENNAWADLALDFLLLLKSESLSEKGRSSFLLSTSPVTKNEAVLKVLAERIYEMDSSGFPDEEKNKILRQLFRKPPTRPLWRSEKIVSRALPVLDFLAGLVDRLTVRFDRRFSRISATLISKQRQGIEIFAAQRMRFFVDPHDSTYAVQILKVSLGQGKVEASEGTRYAIVTRLKRLGLTVEEVKELESHSSLQATSL